MKKWLGVLAGMAFLMCATGLFAVEKDADTDSRRNEKIVFLVASLLSVNHYNAHPIDNEISAKWFNEYLNSLDPMHMFFLDTEIQKMRERYETRLDDLLLRRQGDLSFANQTFEKFRNHFLEYRNFAINELDRPQTFDTEESFVFDRKKAPWPDSVSAMEDLWRQRIRNELLTAKLSARSRFESRADTQKVLADFWNPDSEVQRLKKRLDQVYRIYAEMQEPEVAEIYLSALAHTYDPHSAYFAPSTEEEFNIQMGLQLIGIGAELMTDNGYVKVTRVIPGGPADKSGLLQVNDRIIAAAEKDSSPTDLVDMSLSKAVHFIRGKENSEVTLTILEGVAGPAAQPKNITIVREKVQLKDAEAQGSTEVVKLPNGRDLKVGILVLPSFYYDFTDTVNPKCAYNDVCKILDSFKLQGVEALVLDLRSNGGGALLDAIRISGLFIRTGVVVQVRDAKKNVMPCPDEDPSVRFDGPMVVMVNKLSASASEILAAALQDHKRAIIVGDRQTHGKGTIQELFELDRLAGSFGLTKPLGALKFTNGKFYRANGESTQLRGVIPDIIFPAFTDVMQTGETEYETALPFDTIRPVSCGNYIKDYASVLKTLNANSKSRVDDNKIFALLKEQIENFKELNAAKSISLNENTRWIQYQKEREIMDRQAELLRVSESDKAALGLNADSTRTAPKTAKPKSDIYLNEAIEIVRDLWWLLHS